MLKNFSISGCPSGQPFSLLFLEITFSKSISMQGKTYFSSPAGGNILLS